MPCIPSPQWRIRSRKIWVSALSVPVRRPLFLSGLVGAPDLRAVPKSGGNTLLYPLGADALLSPQFGKKICELKRDTSHRPFPPRAEEERSKINPIDSLY